MVLPVFPWRIPASFPSPAEDWIEKRLTLDDLVLLHPPQESFLIDSNSFLSYTSCIINRDSVSK